MTDLYVTLISLYRYQNFLFFRLNQSASKSRNKQLPLVTNGHSNAKAFIGLILKELYVLEEFYCVCTSIIPPVLKREWGTK